jgi:hypothetical protein
MAITSEKKMFDPEPIAPKLAWWQRHGDPEARAFLFDGSPRFIGWLLTLRSDILFLLLAIPGAALIGLSFLLHLARIPVEPSLFGDTSQLKSAPEAVDLGVLSTLNWSLMFPLVLPYLFGCASDLNRRCFKVTKRLSSDKIGIIMNGDKAALDYPHVVQAEIAKGQKLRFWVSLGIAALMISLFALTWIAPAIGRSNFSAIDLAYQNRWATAWLLPDAAERGISITPNLIYNALAFLLEAFYIFLAFYWIGTFAKFLHSFGSLVASKDNDYRIDIWVEDRENRLGLGSLGSLFTGFLRISVIFLFYGACYSIMSTAWSMHLTERSYIYMIFRERESVFNGIRDMAFAQPTWDLVVSNNGSDLALRILQACLFIPVVVVSYVPIFILKRYLEERIDDERFKTMELRKGAADLTDLDKRWEKLAKAEVWPCGNGTATRYFLFMALLIVAAFLPAVGIGICIAIILTVIAKQIKSWLPMPKWLG